MPISHVQGRRSEEAFATVRSGCHRAPWEPTPPRARRHCGMRTMNEEWAKRHPTEGYPYIQELDSAAAPDSFCYVLSLIRGQHAHLTSPGKEKWGSIHNRAFWVPPGTLGAKERSRRTADNVMRETSAKVATGASDVDLRECGLRSCAASHLSGIGGVEQRAIHLQRVWCIVVRCTKRRSAGGAPPTHGDPNSSGADQ